jgi:hypothetical protein
LIITKTNPVSVSMRSIYPSGDYDYSALSSAVLSKGERAKFTLRYNGVVISTGEVLMGESYATFTPASGTPFTGIIADTTLTISDPVILDDGTPIPLSSMKNITDQVAAFAEYWGVWTGRVQGYPVRLTIGDRTWELYVNGRFDGSGSWIQASANSVRIYCLDPPPRMYIGTTTLKPDGRGMTIVLTGGAYPGTYELSR